VAPLDVRLPDSTFVVGSTVTVCICTASRFHAARSACARARCHAVLCRDSLRTAISCRLGCDPNTSRAKRNTSAGSSKAHRLTPATQRTARHFFARFELERNTGTCLLAEESRDSQRGHNAQQATSKHAVSPKREVTRSTSNNPTPLLRPHSAALARCRTAPGSNRQRAT
jgi:hypothetical protein